MTARLQVVVGGQYGSEGKGAVAGFLAADQQSPLAIRVGGPNAGHTVIGRCPPDCNLSKPLRDNPGLVAPDAGLHPSDRHPWRLRQVPVAAVTNPGATLMLAEGSEIDPEVLYGEISGLDAAGYRVTNRLYADFSATVIEPEHKEQECYSESLPERIGSTGKGIGAARAARAMRRVRLADQVLDDSLVQLTHTRAMIQTWLQSISGTILVEGTQGFHLGTHAGYYPQCTTSDCRAIDMLSMAGVSPWSVRRSELRVWVVIRTYPIRVAGNSGPLPLETTWEALGLPPELTTVTQKIRRVGKFSPALVRQALKGNGLVPGQRPGPVRLALTMADYLVPEIAGQTVLDGDREARLRKLLAEYQQELGLPVSLVGTGPATMIDLRDGE